MKQRDAETVSSMEEDAAADSGSESSDSKMAGSRKAKRAHSVGITILFLQKTKNTKEVKVEDFSSDRELFSTLPGDR